MKKLVLVVAAFALIGTVSQAKEKKNKKKSENTVLELNSNTNLDPSAPNNNNKPASTLKADDLAFDDLNHDFGTVQEGPDALCKFTFVNKGKEPIVIQKAQASCGCTVPSYSKEPVAPGATGTIDVAFHTQGKPAGGFNKTITVTSNAGMKILNIKGIVEKAPTSSVPENNSMLKTN